MSEPAPEGSDERGSAGTSHGSGGGTDGGPGVEDLVSDVAATEGQDLDGVADAAADALRRARAAAVEKGLRPGMRPRRRPRRPRGAMPSAAQAIGRDPGLVGDQVERLVGDRGWGTDVAVGQVMGRWAEIVGGQVAEHCEPVTFEAGVLTVRADSTAWATQIRLLETTILARVAEAIGEGEVAQLRVRGPAAPSWRRGPRRTSDGRGPRDTYG